MSANAVPLPAALLELLHCPAPACRGLVAVRGNRLVCERCGLRYRFDDGWPVMIPEEADPPAASADGAASA